MVKFYSKTDTELCILFVLYAHSRWNVKVRLRNTVVTVVYDRFFWNFYKEHLHSEHKHHSLAPRYSFQSTDQTQFEHEGKYTLG